MEFQEKEMSRVLAAIHFAAEKHRTQRRKDRESTPYINHPIEVAYLLWNEGQVRDISVILGAILHDTIEDTKTTSSELEVLFGEEISALVLEVTDDKTLSRAERKALQIMHAPDKSHRAKLIKLADKICNIRDVSLAPPSEWSEQKKLEYLDWTEKVVEGLRGCHAELESMYDQILLDGRRKLLMKNQNGNSSS